MAEPAGLSMHQEPQTQGKQLTGPNGHGQRPGRPRSYQIRLSDQDWSGGPHGLMSLVEIVHIARFPVERDEEPPPPPPGP
eukprot:1761336-Karenia_brevis.AAC.1